MGKAFVLSFACPGNYRIKGGPPVLAHMPVNVQRHSFIPNWCGSKLTEAILQKNQIFLDCVVYFLKQTFVHLSLLVCLQLISIRIRQMVYPESLYSD